MLFRYLACSTLFPERARVRIPDTGAPSLFFFRSYHRAVFARLLHLAPLLSNSHVPQELRSVGLSPDMLICRSASMLESGTRVKLGQFCQVRSRE